MIIDVQGVPVRVPNCWPKYTDDQKAALCRMVQRLQERSGATLVSVHVDRSVRVGAGWRFDGGWCTRPAKDARALVDDDFCAPITRRGRKPRTWRFHDARPKECYL
jgi:hypothetical protein